MKTSAWWVAALLVAGGCKEEVDGGGADGDADADSDSDGDTDGDADADGDADSDSVPVRVYTQDRRGDRQPAPGALVAFDLPNGARVEQTADGDGRTTFANVDWSGGGTAAVIAHLDGWQLGGITAMTEPYVVGILEATGELMVVLGVDVDSPEGLVEVSGVATMLAPVGDILTVETSTPGRGHQGAGSEWSVLVPPDEPFSLMGLESHPFVFGGVGGQRVGGQDLVAWTVLEHDGVSDATTIELDLTQSVEPFRFNGSLDQPVDTIGDLFGRAYPYVAVNSFDGFSLFAWWHGGLGVVSHLDGLDAPSWTYEGEYVLMDAVPAPATGYYWWREAWEPEWMSRVIVTGPPLDGPQDLDFPEPPIVVSPAPPGAYRLGEVLEWDLSVRDAAEPALEVILVVQSYPPRPGGLFLETIATMFAPPGTNSARIPLPPSDVDTATLLGELGQGEVRLCELDPSRNVCMRYAMGGLFDVVP